ncbi:MAG: 5-formyltetrahydrofolate cyclo-ligase [Epsilonproteobacteria bacterium]|nr:5-formyltetrahydrofolate cyclo-ligase [Campylobacterota bacterium]
MKKGLKMTKKAFRELCKQRLLKAKNKNSLTKKVERNLAFLIERLNSRSLLVFLPLKHEPQLYSYFSKLRINKKVYVPFMQGESFKMVKLRLPVYKKRFGIREPLNSFFKPKIDTAIVPVLGVDGDFRRIGFGMGMYDRFFASLPYRPTIIFIQQRECISAKKVGERFDIQGDFLVTPKQIWIRGNSDVGRDFSRKFCRDSKWRCRIYPIKEVRKRETKNL